jgi:hypothetical protein
LRKAKDIYLGFLVYGLDTQGSLLWNWLKKEKILGRSYKSYLAVDSHVTFPTLSPVIWTPAFGVRCVEGKGQ